MIRLFVKLKKYIRIINSFKLFSRNMENGVYLLDWSLLSASIRCNSVEDVNVKSFLSAKLEHSPLKLFILNALRIVNRNCSGEYHCTKMLLSESGVVKGFDFKKKIVCSLFPSRKDMELYFRQKEFAKKCFPTARTIDVINERCFVTEELLIDNETDIEKKFDAILLFYENLSANLTSTPYTCPIFRYDEQVCQIFDKTISYTDKSYVILRSCVQHGDLWDGNVFHSSGNLKFIDFDKMKTHMCFYDILLYIFTEAFINKDLTLLNIYLSGAYHKTMCRILKVDESESFDYEKIFVIFLNEMFLDRFQVADHRFLMQVLDATESWGIRLVR